MSYERETHKAAAEARRIEMTKDQKTLNILVANDDGIGARGMRALVDALRRELGAKIYIFAPDGQRSAASHAISLRGTIDMWQVDYEGAEAAFALTGTPADCVAVGMKIMRDKGIPVDVMFAGINHGSNVGTDTVYSGTVGCAMEGSIQGIPSAAVSVDGLNAEHFEYACSLAVDLIRKTGGKWDSNVMMNINTPDLPADRIKGVKYTVIGEREYENDIQLVREDGGIATYRYGGEPLHYEGQPNTLDVIAIQEGYASITPLHRDTTAYNAKPDLEKWRIGK